MSAFADFVLARLANRTDAFGRYVRGVTSTAKEPLTPDVVAAHERGEALIGLHAISPAGTCLWVAWDLDNHEERPEVGAENLAAARRLYEAVRASTGGDPILEDSDGQGGYHVWAALSGPVRADRAHGWAVSLCPKGAETFPKQPGLTPTSPYGNWLRLPGKHPRRAHESRILTGAGWVPWQDFHWDDPPLVDATAIPDAPAAPKQAKPDGAEELGAYDDTIREGTRNDVLFRLGSSMRGKGFGEDAIIGALRAENARRCKPPLPDDEVIKAARSASKYAPGEGIPVPSGDDRESVLTALNEALFDRPGRRTRIARIVRTAEAYRIEVDVGGGVRAATIKDTTNLCNADRFADAVADAGRYSLDRKAVRKEWAVLMQYVLDVVEEADVDTMNDETASWLAAVQERPGAVVDLDDPEARYSPSDNGKGPAFLRRGGVLFALAAQVVGSLRKSGMANVGVRDLAKRLHDLGWRRSQISIGGREDRSRVKAWRQPS